MVVPGVPCRRVLTPEILPVQVLELVRVVTLPFVLWQWDVIQRYAILDVITSAEISMALLIHRCRGDIALFAGVLPNVTELPRGKSWGDNVPIRFLVAVGVPCAKSWPLPARKLVPEFAAPAPRRPYPPARPHATEKARRQRRSAARGLASFFSAPSTLEPASPSTAASRPGRGRGRAGRGRRARGGGGWSFSTGFKQVRQARETRRIPAIVSQFRTAVLDALRARLSRAGWGPAL